MAGEISTAIKRLDDRKRAAVEGFGYGNNDVTEEQVRLVASGFDLDNEEMDEIRERCIAAFQVALLQGGRPLTLVGAIFLDGLMTGLLIAEAREREAAKS
jgi:hypothetical protein